MAEPQNPLESLASGLNTLSLKELPPVQSWNPPHCGDIGLSIDREGRWFYQGSQITRPGLVRLFASILRKDPEGYVLVTPAEKVSIAVEDAAFLAVELKAEGLGRNQRLSLRTSLDDWVEIGPDHGLRAETGAFGLKPYVHIRHDLWALASRALTYDLVELAVEQEIDGKAFIGLWSNAMFFPLSEAEARVDEA